MTNPHPVQPSTTALRAFRGALRVLEREILATLEGQTQCCGISMAQCHVLLDLDGAGCVNLTTLAAQQRLDKSTLSRTVDALVREGLVNRNTDAEDRRHQILCLSKQGQARVDTIHQLCDAYYLDLLKQLTESTRKNLFASLPLLAEAMSAQRIATGTSCCKKRS